MLSWCTTTSQSGARPTTVRPGPSALVSDAPSARWIVRNNMRAGPDDTASVALPRAAFVQILGEPDERDDLPPLGDDVADDLSCLAVRVETQVIPDPEGPGNDQDERQ